MKFLEKDLEQVIYETDVKTLRDRGLYFMENGKFKRQQRIGHYGISDLIYYQKGLTWNYLDSKSEPILNIHIIELKKEKIGISAFLQAISYYKGLVRYFKIRNFYNYNINIVLIGKEIDLSGSFCFLSDFCHKIDFFTYEYKIDGLFFDKKDGYTLTNEGFDYGNI